MCDRCTVLTVVHMDGRDFQYSVHAGGSWRYADCPDRIIVRPFPSGNIRHEVPIVNVRSVEVRPGGVSTRSVAAEEDA